MRIFLIFLLFMSCSSKPLEKKILAWEQWKGLSTKNLEDHRYFKTLKLTKVKHDNHLETWTYLDQTPYPTDAYCQSLNGCIGMPMYNCNNVFSVKENVILGFEQQGSCPGAKTIEVSKTLKE